MEDFFVLIIGLALASFGLSFGLCGLLSGARTYREGWQVFTGRKTSEDIDREKAAEKAARRAPIAPAVLWTDPRGQCEGASVTREVAPYPWSHYVTCHNAPSCMECDEAFQCEPED